MKKFYFFKISTLTIISLIFFTGCNESSAEPPAKSSGTESKITAISFPQIGGATPHEVEFNFKEMSLAKENINLSQNGTAFVYSLKKTDLKNDLIPKLGKVFNMDYSKEAKIAKEGSKISSRFDNKDFTLDVFDNGTFNYLKKKRNDTDDINISDEESKKIATEFLKKHNLLPNDFQFLSISHHTLTNAKDPNIQKVLGKEVYFSRAINGIPVYGISRINVEIGKDGEIQGIHSLYREIEQSKKQITIKPVELAIEDIKNFKGTTNALDNIMKINVKKAELVYWEDSTPTSKQQHIQPVYRFTGESFTKTGETKKYESFVPAIPDELTIQNPEPTVLPSDKKTVENPQKIKISNEEKKKY